MSGAPVKITIIGSDAYLNTDQAGLKAVGAPPVGSAGRCRAMAQGPRV
jgi:hypothetical protein